MSQDDDFAAIAQSIADGPSTGLAQVKAEGSKVMTQNFLHYSPELLVDIIIQNPSFSHKELAALFGRAPSWFAAVLATQAFQDALEPRRAEITDPSISATLDERFRALTVRALHVLNEKLDAGKALPDMTVLKAVELGVKALGMGQKEPEKLPAPDEVPMTASERVANRILEAMDRQKAQRTENVIDVEVTEAKTNG